MPPSMTGDEISLVLPAEAAYGRIARITASSLALRLGFPFPEIEDLRIAVDELIILLLRPEGSAGDIRLEFRIEPDDLVIHASTTAGADQPWVNDGALTRFHEIVDELVDGATVSDDGREVTLRKALAVAP